MKDFVRVNIYPRDQQFLPSSTRDGVDALRKILQRNRELYSCEETDFGDLELLSICVNGLVLLIGNLIGCGVQWSPKWRLYESAV